MESWRCSVRRSPTRTTQCGRAMRRCGCDSGVSTDGSKYENGRSLAPVISWRRATKFATALPPAILTPCLLVSDKGGAHADGGGDDARGSDGAARAVCAALGTSPLPRDGRRVLSAVERAEIERVLSSAEQTLAKGERVDLRRLGFWRAVEAVKAHREWIEVCADRISPIDRQVFRRDIWIAVPIKPGLAALAAGTLIGLALVLSAFFTPPPINGLMILGGAGALL